MKIAELYAVIAARTTRFHKAMAGVRASLASSHEAMKKTAAAFTKGFLVVGVAFIGAVAAAAKFEQQMAMVSTMLEGSGAEWMGKYATGIHDLSKEFGESTATLSKGLYDILSASVAPAQALDVLRVATKAAAGGFTTTAVSADAITTILNSYGLEASQAGKVSDLLFSTVKRGKLTFEQLASGIGKAAATSATAGLKLEELMAAISTITRAGISSDQAMTAVVGTIRSFLKPTEEGSALAKKLGFSLNTATLKAEGLTGVFKRINHLSAEQIATLFPNIRGLKGVAAAMQDMKGHALDLEMAMNSAGRTDEAFGKASKTLVFQLKQLKEEFMALAVSLGQTLMPFVNGFMASIKGMLKWFKGLSDSSVSSIIGVLKLAAAFAVAYIAVQKFQLVLKAAFMHPYIAALALLVAGLTMYYDAQKKATDMVIKANEEIGKAETTAQKKITSDQALARELENLLAKQERSNKEQERANTIAKKLQETYGNLGFVYDGLSKNVVGMGGSLERLSRIMKMQAEEALAGTINELAAEEKRLHKQKEVLVKRLNDSQKSGFKFSRSVLDLIRGSYGELEKLGNLILANADRLDAARERLRGSRVGGDNLVPELTPNQDSASPLGALPTVEGNADEQMKEWERNKKKMKRDFDAEKVNRKNAIKDQADAWEKAAQDQRKTTQQSIDLEAEQKARAKEKELGMRAGSLKRMPDLSAQITADELLKEQLGKIAEWRLRQNAELQKDITKEEKQEALKRLGLAKATEQEKLDDLKKLVSGRQQISDDLAGMILPPKEQTVRMAKRRLAEVEAIFGAGSLEAKAQQEMNKFAEKRAQIEKDRAGAGTIQSLTTLSDQLQSAAMKPKLDIPMAQLDVLKKLDASLAKGRVAQEGMLAKINKIEKEGLALRAK